MIRSLLFRALLGFGVIQGASFVSGCSSDSAPDGQESAGGTLTMPLRANAGEHTYWLGGSMQVYGPNAYTYLSLNEQAEVARLILPTGDYQGNLYSWALYRDDGAGGLLPVSAALVSSQVQSFTIFNQTTTTISFQFETNGEIVTVGSGALSVAVDVNEIPGACTPLGEDCPSGTWCPPSELIGQAASCMAAGSSELGAACASPTDCVANASCFDLGQGPVCVSLCGSAELGQPCSGGGTCTAQGVEYGVCFPDAPAL